MQQESDSALIARTREEPEAFGLLYERYVDRIYNYIYYRTGNRDDAEDLTARTFFRAMKHIRRYVDRGAPYSAYLYRIAHNVVANWHRDNKRRQIISIDDLVITTPEWDGPATAAEKSDEQEVLLQVVRQLPPDRVGRVRSFMLGGVEAGSFAHTSTDETPPLLSE